MKPVILIAESHFVQCWNKCLMQAKFIANLLRYKQV